MQSSIRKHSLIAALLFAGALPAHAQQTRLEDGATIRTDDLARLDQFTFAAGSALLRMMAVAPAADRDAVVAALAGEPQPLDEALNILPGTWTCQMMKLSEGPGAVVYQPFTCNADSDGGFEKLTGSQRSRGTIHRDAERLIYLGTGYILDDTSPPAYVDLPEVIDIQASPQRVPEVGIVQVIDANHARILFPEPMLESQFNILLLTR